MVKVLLTRKQKQILIDAEDYYRVVEFTWSVKQSGRKNNLEYAVSWINGKLIRMHRFILDVKDFKTVDHINGNGLDNRKSNLRICTQQQNSFNSKSSVGISKFKGVSTHKNTTKWRAYITVNRKQIHLGYFEKEKDAAKAYNKAALFYFKEFAKLNASY